MLKRACDLLQFDHRVRVRLRERRRRRDRVSPIRGTAAGPRASPESSESSASESRWMIAAETSISRRLFARHGVAGQRASSSPGCSAAASISATWCRSRSSLALERGLAGGEFRVLRQQPVERVNCAA